MAEIWDLYNENRILTGKTHKRGVPLKDGEFHLAVEIILVNHEGKCLITKRHPDKHYGNKWEWQGGSAIQGETSIDAAIRELLEETGILISASEIEYKGSVISVKEHTIYDCYLAQKIFCEDDVILQDGETIDYKIASFLQMSEMLTTGEFLDFLYYRHRSAWGEDLQCVIK